MNRQSAKKFWLPVYLGLVIFSIIAIVVFNQAHSLRDIVLMQYATFSLLGFAIIAEVFTRVNILPRAWSPKRGRTLFYSRPILWCRTVLPASILSVIIIWLALRIIMPQDVSPIPYGFPFFLIVLIPLILLQRGDERDTK
jgi:hypothetical protein